MLSPRVVRVVVPGVVVVNGVNGSNNGHLHVE